VKASISVGCTACTSASVQDEGVVCRLEKGGSEIAGTEVGWTYNDTSASGQEVLAVLSMNYIDVNPVAGTSITYTVGCVELTGANEFEINPTVSLASGTVTPASSLSMIAYPPN